MIPPSSELLIRNSPWKKIQGSLETSQSPVNPIKLPARPLSRFRAASGGRGLCQPRPCEPARPRQPRPPCWVQRRAPRPRRPREAAARGWPCSACLRDKGRLHLCLPRGRTRHREACRDAAVKSGADVTGCFSRLGPVQGELETPRPWVSLVQLTVPRTALPTHGTRAGKGEHSRALISLKACPESRTHMYTHNTVPARTTHTHSPAHPYHIHMRAHTECMRVHVHTRPNTHLHKMHMHACTHAHTRARDTAHAHARTTHVHTQNTRAPSTRITHVHVRTQHTLMCVPVRAKRVHVCTHAHCMRVYMHRVCAHGTHVHCAHTYV